ncbi:glucose-6-phosphate dehydrogenase [Paenibacillus thalictri]|uniref:Glucose-6-phosphate 1-dehydrogenase n=1 Tax=Paenibacillus thalictri TaxID=2527873 RepID=A0A4Q9DRP8_9BACL|nr:glucose-6-phosphate dehydrogenase [Paenibacillus thalictri]TBL78555.1 glucose-6-phosphate dehydrogenase [Paenibacillus thalictri]
MEPVTFVLFGATGDLAKRKIYPALFNLFIDKKLPPSFSVIGLGRRELSDETFQANVAQSLTQFSRRQADEAAKQEFISAFGYNILNIDRKDDYLKLLDRIEQREKDQLLPPNRMFYLSVGPEFFATIAANIEESGLGSAKGWKRLVIEKPFGHDLQSARDLNESLSQAFTEQEIFRIDHYLGKPMVQKLSVLRQNNPVLDALWTSRYISNVQITANETVGVEERAGYYDHVGAVRDMFQNHMLQLLMMLAIQLPKNSTPEGVREQKKRVVEALVPLKKQEVGLSVVRGQYTEGTIQGKPVVSYTSEPNIAPTSMNDTFIAAKLQLDAAFWREVPFYIRTGKRLKEKTTRIVVEFKEPLKQQPSAQDDLKQPNLLVFEISPNEGISLQLNTRDPQHKGELKPIQIDFHANSQEQPEAYENLIFDALQGDPTFFAHWDEVELSWQWVEPILQAFQENLLPLHHYPAGSYGPAESDELLASSGHHWWFDVKPEPNKEKTKGEDYAYHANN